MSRTVLFAGGPLHGKVKALDDHTSTVCALEPPEFSFASLPADQYLMPRQVTYSMSRLVLLGRIIWIGHLGAAPDEDLMFEVLVSGEARRASVLALV